MAAKSEAPRRITESEREKSGRLHARSCSPARRSTRGWATSWRASDVSCRGFRVENAYSLDTDDGPRALADLFDGRSQLLIYHFMFGPSYGAGCPINSSIADSINGVIQHLNARDVTMLLVSQAPLERLQAYKRRMGWDLPWVSSANSAFNHDLGYSTTEEHSRAWVTQNVDSLPPIVERNASASGTDIVGYLTESPGFSAFVLEDGAVYQTYQTWWRGVEFLMGYYPILDRAPKGRDEDEGFQLWIRRHNEYDSQSVTAGRSPGPV